MFDKEKEEKKKLIFLILIVLSGILFLVSLVLSIIYKIRPFSSFVPMALAVYISVVLYRNSKRALQENEENQDGDGEDQDDSEED